MRQTNRANNTSNASQCHPSVTAAQTSCAELEEIISLTPCDEGQTARFA
jgi:hypothetical protein